MSGYLGPREQAIFRGWRTDPRHVHRFYFTTDDDSYAASFGDRTAIGVNAIAVYREKPRSLIPRKKPLNGRIREGAKPAPRSRQESSMAGDTAAQARTGFGDEAWSPVKSVQFDAEREPLAEYDLKYIWREALCRNGIVQCDQPSNRFWPDKQGDWVGYSFAPYPPDYWSQK